MNKKTIIMLFAVAWAAMTTTQQAIAKKLVYLGHNYNGKVNDKNIPEGKGKIEIGGLVIEGIFDGNTIDDARFNTDWLCYKGTITYDREMKVTLKQGGVFEKYYYDGKEISTSPAEATTYHKPIIYQSSIQRVQKKTLKEILDGDREIDMDSLYKEVLKVPHSFEMEGVPAELNPPHVDTAVEVPLVKYLLWDNYNNNQEMFAYVVPSEMNKWVKDYNDSKGRIWSYAEEGLLKDNFGNSQPTYYYVRYPNNSQYASDGSWTVNCSDKYYHTYDGTNKVLLEDYQIIIKNFTGGTELSDFLRYQEAGKTDIVLPIGTQILIPYDDKNANADEIEKKINHVLSFYPLGKPFGAKVFYRDGDNDYNVDPRNQLGVYENGHYKPIEK